MFILLKSPWFQLFNHWWTKTYGLGEIGESKNEMLSLALERCWPFDSPFHSHWLHQTKRVSVQIVADVADKKKTKK